MGYFKDISEMLARKYPDKKVYVISDEHFDHKNIIYMTRNTFSSLEEMNEHIINSHNNIVDPDDIVIILGDFSFRTGTERLCDLVSKLNGHKYLIMGNHDKTERPDVYLKAGFEDVFLSPVKFNEDYYSHYPLNATKESLDRPNNILYNYLCDEFSNSSSGINYHGHQHIKENNGSREKNVACEVVDYKPLLVGRTKTSIENNNLPYVNDEFYEVLNNVILNFNYLKEDRIMIDYIYTILLDLLSEYDDQIVTFGSIMLNKKYETRFNPSDLDVSKIFDSNKSLALNRKSMKELGNDIYKKIIQIEGFNPDFYKKIDFICILSFIYATKSGNYKGYLDMNIILDEFYKSSDFIEVRGCSKMEEFANKTGLDKPKTMKYPRFNVQTTNSMADIINCFLQYVYSTDSSKKRTTLFKLKSIINREYKDSDINNDELENMLIRYLLRNIYFLESSKRKDDINLILQTRDIEIPEVISLNKSIGNQLSIIINSNDYNNILNSIDNSNNKKKEVSKILKYYK